MNVGWIVAVLAGLVLLPSVAGASGGVRPPVRSAGRRKLEPLLEEVEAAGAIPGIRTFALAVALRESRFRSSAANDSASEAKAAARLLRGALSRGFFANNPTIQTDRDAWTFGSGGWFGFLPATGMAAGGKRGPFANAGPWLIFEPVPSVVMLAANISALMHRVRKLPPEHQNWFAVRRGWKSPRLVADYTGENETSRRVNARLVEDLARANGISEAEARAFASRRVRMGNYQGARWLLDRLSAAFPDADAEAAA